MTFDVYVWAAPRDLDVDRAEALIRDWEAAGGDPAGSPFEPTSDVGWFVRELLEDLPGLDIATDAVPRTSRRPIWLETEPEAPARVAAFRIPPDVSAEQLDSIFALAAKYDLVLFNARSRQLRQPLADMAAFASATFWPAGAVQAATAGLVGLAIAVGAWILSIPIISGILIVIGGFLALGSVFTFVQEGRERLRRRRS